MTTDLYRRGQPRDQLMDSWPWLILRTLRCKDAMVAKTSLKKSICALSVFIAIIPTDLLCQIWGKPPRVEFVGTNPVSKREIKFCCRLFTPSIKRLIRQFYDEVVQKRQRNVPKSVMHVPIFFPQLKLFFFLWQTNIPSMMTRNTTQNSLQSVSSMLADDLCLLYCRLKSEVCMTASLNMSLKLISHKLFLATLNNSQLEMILTMPLVRQPIRAFS